MRRLLTWMKQNQPLSNVTVHSAMTAISPVKKGRCSLFFDGMLATPSWFQFSVTEKNARISPEEATSTTGGL